MIIKFADSATHLQPLRAPLKVAKRRLAAGNDNGDVPGNEVMLHAALKQFSRHGIGAAEHARAQAEQAFFAGDRETYKWWLDLCAMLDRRLASSFSKCAEDDTEA